VADRSTLSVIAFIGRRLEGEHVRCVAAIQEPVRRHRSTMPPTKPSISDAA